MIYYQGADCDSVNHKLNLLIPKNVTDPPLLVWIGGGAWSKVNRQVAMDETYLRDQGVPAAMIKGVVAVSGIYDVPHYREILEDLSN